MSGFGSCDYSGFIRPCAHHPPSHHLTMHPPTRPPSTGLFKIIFGVAEGSEPETGWCESMGLLVAT